MSDVVASNSVSWDCRFRLDCPYVEDISFVVKVDTSFGPMFRIVAHDCYITVKEWQLVAVLARVSAIGLLRFRMTR